MCTVVLLARPGHDWPLLLAANRDEKIDRPWDPPGRHWPGRPGVVAGRDRLGEGTWLGVNASGVAAAVLNRPGSLGPDPDKRSRGSLPLLALEQPDARAAADAVCGLDAGRFRTFNMVVADRNGAVFLRGLGHGRPEAVPLSPGVHMVTAHDPDDPASPRTARHLPRFRDAAPPRPEADDWAGWQGLLSDGAPPREASINVPALGGFGTVCSTLLALPAAGAPIWLFAPGPPDHAPFRRVAL